MGHGRRHSARHRRRTVQIDRRPRPRDRRRGLSIAPLAISAWQLLQSASRDSEAGNSDRRKGFCSRVIRVFIVAASPLILAGLHSLLADSGVDIVGSAADLESLARQLDDVEPDVLLVETSAPAQESLLDELVAGEFLRGYPVVVLAQNMPPGWPSEALHAGVRAVLPSEVSAGQLLAALEPAAAGLVRSIPVRLSRVLPAPPD